MTQYSGIWPVAPTPFFDDGAVDFDGMKRVLDCLIDQGADGICILANFSEQFLISDAERDALARLCVEHIAGRVPIIVTISHFATQIAVERARFAKEIGADIVMMMPPYHGALLKGNAQQSFEQFAAVGEVGIPIMVQDAPLSGVELPVPLLLRMAREIEMVKLFKIECPRASNKLRALIAEGREAIEAPFDGEEAITLLADLDAGATGSMTSGMIVDQIKPVITHHLAAFTFILIHMHTVLYSHCLFHAHVTLVCTVWLIPNLVRSCSSLSCFDLGVFRRSIFSLFRFHYLHLLYPKMH